MNQCKGWLLTQGPKVNSLGEVECRGAYGSPWALEPCFLGWGSPTRLLPLLTYGDLTNGHGGHMHLWTQATPWPALRPGDVPSLGEGKGALDCASTQTLSCKCEGAGERVGG